MGWRASPSGDSDEDELTFEEFVTATAGRLLRTAVFLVRDRHLAEDFVQTTYERVARRWPRVRRGGHPEAYARKVLVNLVVDHRERRARRRELLFGEVADVEGIAGGTDPHASIPGAVDDFLARLPVKQRAVIVLRYWCDLSEQEIAEAMDISQGTVKSHAARAMAALREHVVQEGSRSE